MDPRINVITLGVTDFARSLAFYRDGFGWKAEVLGASLGQNRGFCW